MLRFVEWEKNRILFEMLGGFSYVFPKKKIEQMYDFYMLNMLLGRSSFEMKRNKIIGQGGPDPFSLGGPRTSDGRDWDAETKVDHMLEEVAKELLPTLKEQLLKEVMYSISAEVRHIFDQVSEPTKTIFRIVKDRLGEQAAKLVKEYAKRYTLNTSHIYAMDDDRKRKPPDENSYMGYKDSYDAIKKSGGSPKEWAEIAKFLFEELSWNSSYGGKSWANIAQGWLTLNAANSRSDLIKYIDHIYDLQHNSDTVFNKLTSYADEAGSHRWIAQTLDHKAAIKNPISLVNNVSPSFRKLALRAIKIKWDTTLEDEKKGNLSNKPTNNIKQTVPTNSTSDVELDSHFSKTIFYNYQNAKAFNTQPLLALARLKRLYVSKHPDFLDNMNVIEQLVDGNIKKALKDHGVPVNEIAIMNSAAFADEFFNIRQIVKFYSENGHPSNKEFLKNKTPGQIASAFVDTYGLSPHFPIPTQLRLIITKELGVGNPIMAIKKFREYSLFDLKSAKSFVDKIHLDWHLKNKCNCLNYKVTDAPVEQSPIPPSIKENTKVNILSYLNDEIANNKTPLKTVIGRLGNYYTLNVVKRALNTSNKVVISNNTLQTDRAKLAVKFINDNPGVVYELIQNEKKAAAYFEHHHGFNLYEIIKNKPSINPSEIQILLSNVYPDPHPPVYVSAFVYNKLVTFLNKSQKLDAIKEFRKHALWGLLASKSYIEWMQALLVYTEIISLDQFKALHNLK